MVVCIPQMVHRGFHSIVSLFGSNKTSQKTHILKARISICGEQCYTYVSCTVIVVHVHIVYCDYSM